MHTKQDSIEKSATDHFSVIAVLADVDASAQLSGSVPWEQLDASAIQECGSFIPISNFRFDSLLPESLDYYYYEGSLTAPPCTESVNWFVLKDRITVPGEYLDQLRRIGRNTDGDPLPFNFRDAQDIGERVVYSQILNPANAAIISLLMVVTTMVCNF